MQHLNHKRPPKGVLLIICLLVLVVLTAISLTMVSATRTTSKASKYSSAKFEAQQKADAIANYAVSQLIPNHTNDITPCAMGKSCLVWNSAPPASAYLSSSNTTQKTWWRANGQDYPNATQLHALTTAYSSTTGANATDTVASFFVSQDATSTDASGYPIRTLRIVAYATDSKGTTGAVKQQFYTYISNCKTTPVYATSLTAPCQSALNNLYTNVTFCGSCGFASSCPSSSYGCPAVGATSFPWSGNPGSCTQASNLSGGWGGIQYGMIYQVVAPWPPAGKSAIICCNASGVNLSSGGTTCR